MTIRVLHGDCRDILKTLPDASVQMCVTSPPYWGLRDYGVDATVWGGNPECDHEWGDVIAVNATNHTDKRRWNQTRNGRDEEQPTEKRVAWLRTKVPQGKFCHHCGAWAGALGLEPTPELFIAHIVEVFAEVRRVLRDDGVLFMNLGDSYATGGGSIGRSPGGGEQGARFLRQGHINTQPNRMPLPGLKPKDLIGIPWMAAFALRSAGWWLRSDIIWAKPNPMPESVTDRPTSAHEHLFLFVKSGDHTFWTHRNRSGTRNHPEPDYRWIHRKTKEEVRTAPSGSPEEVKQIWQRVNLWSGHDYFWDAEAIRQPMAEASIARLAQNIEAQEGSARANGGAKINGTMKAVGRTDKQRGHGRRHDGFNDRWDAMPKDEQQAMGANCRNVWTMATQPFSEAHFATFPPDLAERCILAATSAHGCCSACGAPLARITTKGEPDMVHRAASGADASGGYSGRSTKGHDSAGVQNASDVKRRILEGMREKAYSWEPTCSCDAVVRPCTVLDPFGGAGTSGLVADRLGRDAILIELNPEYADMARRRVERDAGLFAEVVNA